METIGAYAPRAAGETRGEALDGPLAPFPRDSATRTHRYSGPHPAPCSSALRPERGPAVVPPSAGRNRPLPRLEQRSPSARAARPARRPSR
ncbi:hypothetical protein GCM10010420_26030 [Streptomyces glaucosporus]|uniref:Uncharacterized protein n=1 Tax=Streptomyces glaucosporus TaxID=284044 RepID=A0ABP5VB72_9ACTN